MIGSRLQVKIGDEIAFLNPDDNYVILVIYSNILSFDRRGRTTRATCQNGSSTAGRENSHISNEVWRSIDSVDSPIQLLYRYYFTQPRFCHVEAYVVSRSVNGLQKIS